MRKRFATRERYRISQHESTRSNRQSGLKQNIIIHRCSADRRPGNNYYLAGKLNLEKKKKKLKP